MKFSLGQTERDFIEASINKIIAEGLLLRELIAAKPTEKRLRRIERMCERSERHDKHGKIAEKRGRRNSH